MSTKALIKGIDGSSRLLLHCKGQDWQRYNGPKISDWRNQKVFSLRQATRTSQSNVKPLPAVQSFTQHQCRRARARVHQQCTPMGIRQKLEKDKFDQHAIHTAYLSKKGGPRRTVCRAAEAGLDTVAGPKSSDEESIVLLKEWKVMIDALAAGDQIFILRKGGIHERAFTPPSSEFLFFPSFFHATPSMLKPDFLDKHSKVLDQGPHERQLGDAVELTAHARCTGAWSTKDPDILSRLKDLHIWTDEFLEKRLAWKADRPLTILELRVTPLLQAVHFGYAKEHGGCKSWVTLPVGTLSGHPTAGEPCLSDADFAQAQSRLRERLRGVHLEWQSA